MFCLAGKRKGKFLERGTFCMPMSVLHIIMSTLYPFTPFHTIACAENIKRRNTNMIKPRPAAKIG